MCGITGYTGQQNAVPVLMEGLKRLEYRGYDSAGIAVQGKSSLSIAKCVAARSASWSRFYRGA